MNKLYLFLILCFVLKVNAEEAKEMERCVIKFDCDNQTSIDDCKPEDYKYDEEGSTPCAAPVGCYTGNGEFLSPSWIGRSNIYDICMYEVPKKDDDSERVKIWKKETYQTCVSGYAGKCQMRTGWFWLLAIVLVCVAWCICAGLNEACKS